MRKHALSVQQKVILMGFVYKPGWDDRRPKAPPLFWSGRGVRLNSILRLAKHTRVSYALVRRKLNGNMFVVDLRRVDFWANSRLALVCDMPPGAYWKFDNYDVAMAKCQILNPQ